ncbi:methylenetetrahydrofolate reductase [Buchnera aphidicola (Mollitrichosiphum nigrofasciatum)]|uniref:methylenetetrahydrofolate reductase n=1 Tax=Buchnera aphidicola TaxID=9 RepID=UPI0031B84C5F
MNYLNDIHLEKINTSLLDFKNINISCEFFPSSNKKNFDKLLSITKRLSFFNPFFFSVTYGANSGERNLTRDTVLSIKKNTKIKTIPHLTCVDLTFGQIQKIAENYWNNGIKSIIALRGDYPINAIKKDIYALDLVCFLKKIANFKIFVAAYPEVHPEAKSAHFDLINLKKKIDAGAIGAITQFFFDADKFLFFRDLCVANGINKKIIPGILPILDIHQLKRFSSLTNVYIPKYILNMYEGLDNDPITRSMLGFSIAIDMLKKLYNEGVRDFHFYTLNKLEIIYPIFHFLGSYYKLM